LANHLIKCRRSHSTKGTKVCRFNLSHVFPVDEIEIHEESCVDRRLVELWMEADRKAATLKREESSKRALETKKHDHGENWDDVSSN
jgi:hypothetical protein